MSAEYLRKSATESNGIFGTLRFCVSWALSGTTGSERSIGSAATANASVTKKDRFM